MSSSIKTRTENGKTITEIHAETGDSKFDFTAITPATIITPPPPTEECPEGYIRNEAGECVPKPVPTGVIPPYVYDNTNTELVFDLHNAEHRKRLYGNKSTIKQIDDYWLFENKKQIRSMVMYPGNTSDDDNDREKKLNPLADKFDEIAKRGYMLDKREVNAWVIMVDANVIPKSGDSSDGGLTIEPGAGIRHNEDFHDGKFGTCYHHEVNKDGTAQVQKEMYHVSYTKGIVGGKKFDTKQRFQMIGVCKRVNAANAMDGMIVQTWVKRPGSDKYTLDAERVDKNDWGDDMQEVHKSFKPGQAITWGSDCLMTIKSNGKSHKIWDIKAYALRYA